MTLRLLIVDDHAIVRQGIRSLIEQRPDWLVVGEAASGLEALSLCKELLPDITLLDLSMPKSGGLDVVKELAALTRVLVFTMHEEEEYVRHVMALGGHGYVLKGAPGSDVIRAVDSVSQGKRYVDPAVASLMLNFTDIRSSQTRALSSRERAVLRLAALGRMNKEIAEELHVSVRTVETYRKRLQTKLGLTSRAEIIRHAIAAGLID